MTGRVHSRESFGTVDGPGLRYVVFLQGCPMRCLYCHNPDTWEGGGGTEIEAAQIIADICKNRAFYQKGGLTVSGGEPLCQIDFLIDLFTRAKEESIHTCLDTSGILFDERNPVYLQKLDRLMTLTDLVLLDIKHIDDAAHRVLTGHTNAPVLAFAHYLEQKKVPVWIRHVVLEGYTDQAAAWERLGTFIGSLSNLQALDVLPYHTMGTEKYRALGLAYPLDGIPAASSELAESAKRCILEAIRKVRTSRNKLI